MSSNIYKESSNINPFNILADTSDATASDSTESNEIVSETTINDISSNYWRTMPNKISTVSNEISFLDEANSFDLQDTMDDFNKKEKVNYNFVDSNSNFYLKKTDSLKKETVNKKKILCQNIINYGSCCYGTKCLFAHKLEEQIIDNNKKQSYDIVMNSYNLSHIDLQKNYVLYRSLLNLTKLCDQCAENKCKGGFNCKFGSCSKNYQICKKDLEYGNCVGCDLVHLTHRDLVPFYHKKNDNRKSLYNDKKNNFVLSSNKATSNGVTGLSSNGVTGLSSNEVAGLSSNGVVSETHLIPIILSNDFFDSLNDNCSDSDDSNIEFDMSDIITEKLVDPIDIECLQSIFG